MKTLIVHPHDPTTDFLAPSYYTLELQDSTTLLCDISTTQRQVKEAIREHDRVIVMGHGTHRGLNRPRTTHQFLINNSFSYALAGKTCIFIWCYAREYMEAMKITGYGTSMVISEMNEALYLGVDCTEEHIKQANTALVDALASQFEADVFIPENFILKYKDQDKYQQNPVMNYNLQSF